MVNKDLEKIKEIIDSWDCTFLPKEHGPYTVSLVDEEDPTGIVEFKGRDGVSRMQMPREDYDAIREYEGNYDPRSN
jgi:hypothetical protein